MILSKDDLMSISGGTNFSVIAGIGAAIAFLISIVDGFINPGKCS